MESVRCAQWVGADPPRSASKGSLVAESIFTASSSAGSAGPEAFCAPSSKASPSCPIAVAQPFTCDSRCRGSCRSQAVASLHRSSWGAQCPCEGPPGRPPRCSEQSQVATDPGTVGVVQDVPRSCTEAGSSSPGCDRQGHRAEGHIRIGGDGGSTQTRGSPGRSCADASTTRDAFNCVELQDKIDTLVKERDALRSRPDQPGVSKHSDKWMEEGPPCVKNIPPMPSTNVQEFGGMDQRSQLRIRRHEFGGQDRTSGWARGQPTRVNWQRRDHDRSIEVFREVLVDRRSGSQTPVHRCKQCEWSSSRYGHRSAALFPHRGRLVSSSCLCPGVSGALGLRGATVPPVGTS